MALYKVGQLTVAANTTAQNLNLGFVPSVFTMINQTFMIKAAASDVDGIAYVYWDQYLGALSTPATLIDTYTNGAALRSAITTTGIVPFQSADSALFLPNQVPYTTNQSTNLTITAISKAANASITATHSFTSADVGVTVVTFHNIRGMTQMNTLSGVIQSVNSTTDFTVNINSSNFSTYVSGGVANVITGAPANTLYSNTLLPTAEANLGQIGLTLGTGIMITQNDIWTYQAWGQSPVTGP